MKEIDRIKKDIQDLNIQGATNVAIATLEGMKIIAESFSEGEGKVLIKEFYEVGNSLAYARPNEPLAQNGVKYVMHRLKKEFPDLQKLQGVKRKLSDYCDEYLDLIADSKKSIIEKCTPYVRPFENILTHCHSSTAIALIKVIADGKDSFDAVCTETRPLYQGRKTAKSLLDAGISTTMIADSAAESFVVGRGSITIDGVFIGCDAITMRGHCINKIGSWGIAMAAYYAEKPLYVVSPLLKLESSKDANAMTIEIREDKELWEDAPKGLNLFNPAFEFVDNKMISGFMTEFGIINPKEIHKIAQEKYPWLFED